MKELDGLSPAQRSRRLAAIQGRLVDSEQEEDDLDDTDRDVLIDEYTAAQEIEQLRAEVAALKELAEDARRVREAANDSKLKALKACLERGPIRRVEGWSWQAPALHRAPRHPELREGASWPLGLYDL